MKKQIKHFSVWQTSKVMALLYFIFSALIFFTLGIIAAVRHEEGVAILFALPFIYAIFCLIGTAFCTWIYNLIAKSVGGIEFTLINMEDTTSLPKE